MMKGDKNMKNETKKPVKIPRYEFNPMKDYEVKLPDRIVDAYKEARDNEC
jgi:hypothetical protein